MIFLNDDRETQQLKIKEEIGATNLLATQSPKYSHKWAKFRRALIEDKKKGGGPWKKILSLFFKIFC